MSPEFEIYQHQRKLKRKLIFWRIFTMFAIFLVIVIAAIFFTDFEHSEKNEDHIARISISGVIPDEYSITTTLLELQSNENVKGVIVSIDSPGGSTFAGESLYNELRLVSNKKPVVAQIGAYGASGGYLIALAADHIIAQRNSITGSIGVALELFNTSNLLEKVGVTYDAVTSSPLKDQPNLFQEINEEGLSVMEDLVNDTYDWFIGIVAERRSFSLERAKEIGDGRIYNGNQALKLGLIDEIGEGREVLNWMDNQLGLDEKLPVVNWETNQNNTKLTLSDIFTISISEIVKNILVSNFGIQTNFHPEDYSTKGLISILQFPTHNSAK